MSKENQKIDKLNIFRETFSVLLGITSATNIWKGRKIKRTKIEEDI